MDLSLLLKKVVNVFQLLLNNAKGTFLLYPLGI